MPVPSVRSIRSAFPGLPAGRPELIRQILQSSLRDLDSILAQHGIPDHSDPDGPTAAQKLESVATLLGHHGVQSARIRPRRNGWVRFREVYWTDAGDPYRPCIVRWGPDDYRIRGDVEDFYEALGKVQF